MGPLSSGVPMGASHGIGYILGALFDVPHGYTSCVMLPAVMRWNKPANAERQALVATAMGQPGQDAGDVLDGFIRGLGLPSSLGGWLKAPCSRRGCPETHARLRGRLTCVRFLIWPPKFKIDLKRTVPCILASTPS
jgi:Iron-containing alcohol dehydrogenase